MRAIKIFCSATAFVVIFSPMDFLTAESSRVSVVSDSPVAAIAWSSPGDIASNHHDAPYKRLLSPFTVSYLQPRWADTSDAVWHVGANARETTWEAKFPAYAGGSGSFSRVMPTHIDSDPHHSPIMVGKGGNACYGS